MQERNRIVFYQVIIKFILFSLIFSSCKQSNHEIVKEFYSTGELLTEISFIKKSKIKDGVFKEYYKNGTVKKIVNFKNNLPIDTAFLYDKYGKLKFKEIIKEDTIYSTYYNSDGTFSSKSKFINTTPPIKIGWEVIYNKQGKLSDSIEYINLNNSSYLNQRIKINREDKINLDSSFFYNIKISKILNTEFYQLNVSYIPLNKKAQVFMVLSNDLNKDFSNLNKVQFDTLFMDNNKLITNKLKKESRKLVGYFYEYHPIVSEFKKDSVKVTIKEKEVYFNKTFFVTDTIQMVFN